jgi:hypothetical protein
MSAPPQPAIRPGGRTRRGLREPFHHSNADAAVRREVCVDPAVAIAIAAGWVLGRTPRSRLHTTRIAVAGVAG